MSYQEPLPSHPMTTDAGPSGVVVRPPGTIVASFWCWLVSALLWVVGGVLILSARQSLVDSLRRSNSNGTVAHPLTEAQIQQAANISVTAVIIVAVIIAALYALFAAKLRAGRNWARVVLTIIAVLALIYLVTRGFTSTSLISYVGAILSVVAAVLSYLPASNAYIAAVKHSRR